MNQTRYFWGYFWVGLVALLVAGTATQAVHASRAEWRFRVFLDDKEIGTHVFTVDSMEAGRVVTSDALFSVKIFFVEAYRYVHDNKEFWRNGCVIGIEAKTDDNGETEFVRGNVRENALSLETHAGPKSVNGCVRTFAYWDLDALRGASRLLNAQTGENLPATLTEEGVETVSIRGAPVEAKRFRLRAKALDIVLWYSPNGDWLQLDSVTEDGKLLRYRLI